MSKKIKRRKPKAKYIKDKCIEKFLLQHLDKQKIDFKKIKISSFFDNINDSDVSQSSSEVTSEKTKKNYQIFDLSILEGFQKEENNQRDFEFSSSIFK